MTSPPPEVAGAAPPNGAAKPAAEAVPAPEAAATAAGASGPALVTLLEGVLFVADRPLSLSELAQVLEAPRPAVEGALRELAAVCAGRGVRLQRTNGFVQLVSAPETVGRYLGLEASARRSRAALETLSIIAYRQPITRPELEDLRGVSSEAVLRTLVARGLVEAVGQRETVGHPIEYATTFRFLEYFGLTGLEELPPLDAPGPDGVPGLPLDLPAEDG
jgi:segregation and condensation protein B